LAVLAPLFSGCLGGDGGGSGGGVDAAASYEKAGEFDPKAVEAWLALGAVLPDLLDKPLGFLVLGLPEGRLVGHTLLFAGAWLAAACQGDADLQREVEDLLAAHEASTTGFLSGDAAGASLADPAERAIGTRIGRYRVRSVIGEGGMGVVYQADQEEPIRRRVAVKLIKVGMDTREVVARFESERQALALMSHPNIARVLDGGASEEGRPYFVMELVEGVPITDYADRLLDDMALLEGWSDRVLTMQRNWIGRSEGARVTFSVAETGREIPVFTTRPDTLWGVTFFVLAPEHPLARELVTGTAYEADFEEFLTKVRRESDIDRTAIGRQRVGMFIGAHVTNICVHDRGVTRFVRILPTGGRDITLAVKFLPGRSQRVAEHMISAKKTENLVEHLYREGLVELFKNPNVIDILKMRELFRHLSNAADRGDEAADIIGDILVKM
jgi:hypothetical protein